MNIDATTLDPSKIPGSNRRKVGFVHFVTELIPETLFAAFTGRDPAGPARLVFRFRAERHQAQSAPSPPSSTAVGIIFRIVGWVMKLAPFGTFGLAAVVANYGASSLANLGMLVLVFTGTCVVYIFVILWLISRACTEPVRADPLPQDRTDHRAGHRVQRSGAAAADAEAGKPRRRTPSSA